MYIKQAQLPVDLFSPLYLLTEELQVNVWFKKRIVKYILCDLCDTWILNVELNVCAACIFMLKELQLNEYFTNNVFDICIVLCDLCDTLMSIVVVICVMYVMKELQVNVSCYISLVILDSCK